MLSWLNVKFKLINLNNSLRLSRRFRKEERIIHVRSSNNRGQRTEQMAIESIIHAHFWHHEQLLHHCGTTAGYLFHRKDDHSHKKRADDKLLQMARE